MKIWFILFIILLIKSIEHETVLHVKINGICHIDYFQLLILQEIFINIQVILLVVLHYNRVYAQSAETASNKTLQNFTRITQISPSTNFQQWVFRKLLYSSVMNLGWWDTSVGGIFPTQAMRICFPIPRIQVKRPRKRG